MDGNEFRTLAGRKEELLEGSRRGREAEMVIVRKLQREWLRGEEMERGAGARRSRKASQKIGGEEKDFEGG